MSRPLRWPPARRHLNRMHLWALYLAERLEIGEVEARDIAFELWKLGQSTEVR